MKNIDLETPQGTRTENLIIRVTKQEKEAFAVEAQRVGISISAFIRLLLREFKKAE